MKTIAFESPTGHVVKIESPLLGCFLLGPLHLLFSGAFMPALIYFFGTVLTGGLAWLILPFWAESMLRKYYASQGWKEVEVVKSRGGEPMGETGLILGGLGVMALGCLGFMLFLYLI